MAKNKNPTQLPKPPKHVVIKMGAGSGTRITVMSSNKDVEIHRVTPGATKKQKAKPKG